MSLLGLIVAIVVAIFAFDTRRRLRGAEGRLAKVGEQLARMVDEAAIARRQPPAAAGDAVVAATPVPVAAPSIPARASAVPAIAATAAAAPPAVTKPSLEEKLGTRWAVWVGGLALALGAVLMVRYSIERGVFRSEEQRLNSSHLRLSRMPSSA